MSKLAAPRWRENLTTQSITKHPGISLSLRPHSAQRYYLISVTYTLNTSASYGKSSIGGAFFSYGRLLSADHTKSWNNKMPSILSIGVDKQRAFVFPVPQAEHQYYGSGSCLLQSYNTKIDKKKETIDCSGTTILFYENFPPEITDLGWKYHGNLRTPSTDKGLHYSLQFAVNT